MQAFDPSTHFKKEASAAYIGVSLSTFNRMYLQEKKFAPIRVSPKIIYFKKEDLDQYLQNQNKNS